MTNEEYKHLKLLKRRIAHLTKRIAQFNGSFDRHERQALVWIIEAAGLGDQLDDLREEHRDRDTSLSKY